MPAYRQVGHSGRHPDTKEKTIEYLSVFVPWWFDKKEQTAKGTKVSAKIAEKIIIYLR
jgi:hypothetical protein